MRVSIYNASKSSDKNRYSENLTELDTEKKYWFQGTQGSSLFRFYQYPVSPTEFETLLNGKSDVDIESVVF